MIRTTTVVLPVPGPPVMTVRRLPSACSSARSWSGSVRPLDRSLSRKASIARRIASVTGVFASRAKAATAEASLSSSEKRLSR